MITGDGYRHWSEQQSAADSPCGVVSLLLGARDKVAVSRRNRVGMKNMHWLPVQPIEDAYDSGKI